MNEDVTWNKVTWEGEGKNPYPRFEIKEYFYRFNAGWNEVQKEEKRSIEEKRGPKKVQIRLKEV